MDVKEFDELINALPKVKIDEPISSMNSINIEDLENAVERLKKIPTYQDLLKENQKMKEVIDKTIKNINMTIEIIKKQPTGNDDWILKRLNSFKFILDEVE